MKVHPRRYRTRKTVKDFIIKDKHFNGQPGVFIENGGFCLFINNKHVRPRDIVVVWQKESILIEKIRSLHYILKEDFSDNPTLDNFMERVMEKMREQQ